MSALPYPSKKRSTDLASWVDRAVEIKWRAEDSPNRIAVLDAIDVELRLVLLRPQDGGARYWASLDDIHGIIETGHPPGE